jgi:hypothetical protein
MSGRKNQGASSGSREQAAQLRKTGSRLRAEKNPGRLLTVEFKKITAL